MPELKDEEKPHPMTEAEKKAKELTKEVTPAPTLMPSQLPAQWRKITIETNGSAVRIVQSELSPLELREIARQILEFPTR